MSQIDGRHWFIQIGAWRCFEICNMNCLFGPDCSCHQSLSVNTICARVQLSQRGNQLRRLIVSCDWPKQVTITKQQRAEFRLANMYCIPQHRLENGFELAGRPADDLQHFGCRALLLQCLGQLALALFELLFQLVSVCLQVQWRSLGLAVTGSTHSRLRSYRTKVATLRSVLRPLARQGHLVGTVAGPLSVGPSQGLSLSILAEPHDELPQYHSITSSARPDKGSGTVMPSALAVFRYRKSSTLVDR